MQNSTKFPSASKLLMCITMSSLVTISSLPISASATDYNYYKSTGESGEVFLTQFTRRGVKAELVSKRSDGRAEEVGDMNGRTNTKPVKKKSTQELRLEALEAEKKKRDEKEKIGRCQKMRENLTQVNIGGKLYETGESGERNYMTDSQISEKRRTIQDGLEQFCKGI